VLGLLETLLLVLSAKPILGYMGVTPDSAMMKPALQYLVLRSLGAPAVLLSLAMQGVFRGLKDTKTPLYATVAGDAINIVLDPIFMFVFQYGVRGAAIAHVISHVWWNILQIFYCIHTLMEIMATYRFVATQLESPAVWSVS
jgi:Na+-driven multidrug efflux pump